MLRFHVMRKEVAVDNTPANVTFHVHGTPFMLVILVPVIPEPGVKDFATELTFDVELFSLRRLVLSNE